MVSAVVVASICGCWRRESGVNPGIWESLIPCDWDYEYEKKSKGGYGLGQWTNVGTSHGRLYNLHTWVTENGYEDGDGIGQIEFMKYESYWAGSKETRGTYTSLEEFLASTSTSIDDLVWDFLANWEGVAGNNYEERVGYANTFLTYISEHANDEPSSFTWTSSNSYITLDEMKSNVMCIYFHLNPTKPKPTRAHKLPIYMMLRRRHRVY